jgi:GTP-binding protein EngB required for normal cell division
MPFNKNHKRYLLATFQYIDKLLAQAASNLGPVEGNLLFPPCVPDASPTQRQVISDYMASFRNTAKRFLETAQIHRDEPVKGALWSLRVSLDFVWTSLADIEPKRLSGYGTLDPDAAMEAERALAELHSILRQLTEYLERGLGGDISARLEKLDQTRDEVALLRELERVIRTHGLVEFQATLSWLAERFERSWLEVAFFGRVSCGKSSLVNALLGRDILPTGVTPVTAVPTRIIPGRSPRATVSFARLPSRQVDLDRLADFATEERNPSNEKRVVDILVEAPSPRLVDGVCFVDTPGLGSLATAGAAQSLAYLPRCDIGVLLIDAAGSLSEEDISVARAILESGAILIPVLSKADLLSAAELQKMTAYVRGQLRGMLGLDPPLSPISVMPASTHLASQWFERYLAPRLQERRSLRSASLRRKVGSLREAVVAALSLRTRHGDEKGRTTNGSPTTARTLADARSLLARSRRRVVALAEKIREYQSTLIDVAAASLAESWTARPGVPEGGSSPASVSNSVALSVAREADGLGVELSSVVEEARQALQQALASASDSVPLLSAGSDALPDADARPLFDPQYLFRDLQFLPGIRGLFGRSARREDARRKLLKALGPSLTAALEAYAGALKKWSEESLDSLEKAFDASAATFSVMDRFRISEESALGEENRAAATADLELLRAWNGDGTEARQRDSVASISHA